MSTAIDEQRGGRARARARRGAAQQRDHAGAGARKQRDLGDLARAAAPGTEASAASVGAFDHGAPVWAAW